MYRQGDVLLIKVLSLPADVKPLDHTTVAYGEATGHHHSFTSQATLFQSGPLMFVVAEPGAVLTHQEHAPIAVDPGVYEVRIQREYHPAEIRQVLD